MSLQSADDLNKAGIAAYNAGNYLKAVDDFTAALQLEPLWKLKAALYKNRGLARLKPDEYEGCETNCSKALELSTGDYTLFHCRARALEKLNAVQGAMEDCVAAHNRDSSKITWMETMKRLVKKSAERQKKLQSAEYKAEEMRKTTDDKQQQLKELNNLLVLARDSETGATNVWQDGEVVERLLKIIENSVFSDEQAVAAIRVIDELCRSHERAIDLIDLLGIPKITQLIAAWENVFHINLCLLIVLIMISARSLTRCADHSHFVVSLQAAEPKKANFMAE